MASIARLLDADWVSARDSAAAAYCDSGWHVVRLKPQDKQPAAKGWRDARPNPTLQNFENVGVALGEPSGGLVDFDLDCPEAIVWGDYFLGLAPAFGRESKRRSHRLVRVDEPAKTRQFQYAGDMLVELRSTGGQTMFPPSIHPAGEDVSWDAGLGELPTMDWAEAERIASLIALLSVVLRAYPRTDGSRDNICLALAGALLKFNIEAEQVDDIVVTLAKQAGDEEAEDRRKAIRTATRQESDLPTTGLPALCEQLNLDVGAMRAWMGIEIPGNAIVLVDGQLVRIVDDAEARLIESGAPLYQRGQTLIRTAMLGASTDTSGVRRARGSVVLLPANNLWLTEQFARSAVWLRSNAKGETRAVDPPAKYANHYLARVGDWKVPALLGIVHTPTLRPDGSLLQTPGYDAESLLIYDPLGVEFPLVPEHPSRDDAAAALDLLDSLFAKFPFVDDAARSTVLAAALTALVRRSIRTAPLFALDAPTAGTGKSLIAETIGVLATGHLPAMISQGKSAEEDEKRLSTLLMAGDPMIVIDNCDLPLEGDFLCSMLTQEMVQARILGRSERVRLPSNTLIMATGNNLTLSGDVTRRAVLCRMNAEVERPDARQFDFDPREVANDRRAEIVVAGLTILRAYIAAGRPRPLDRIGSFEDWNLIREPLVWLGRADPADTRAAVLGNDPRKNELLEILTAWRACFGDGEMTLTDVRKYCQEDLGDPDRERLHNLLVEQTAKPAFNARSIGRHLRRYVDRVVGGMALKNREGNLGLLWRVEAMTRQPELDYGEWS